MSEYLVDLFIQANAVAAAWAAAGDDAVAGIARVLACWHAACLNHTEDCNPADTCQYILTHAMVPTSAAADTPPGVTGTVWAAAQRYARYDAGWRDVCAAALDPAAETRTQRPPLAINVRVLAGLPPSARAWMTGALLALPELYLASERYSWACFMGRVLLDWSQSGAQGANGAVAPDLARRSNARSTRLELKWDGAWESGALPNVTARALAPAAAAVAAALWHEDGPAGQLMQHLGWHSGSVAGVLSAVRDCSPATAALAVHVLCTAEAVAAHLPTSVAAQCALLLGNAVAGGADASAWAMEPVRTVLHTTPVDLPCGDIKLPSNVVAAVLGTAAATGKAGLPQAGAEFAAAAVQHCVQATKTVPPAPVAVARGVHAWAATRWAAQRVLLGVPVPECLAGIDAAQSAWEACTASAHHKLSMAWLHGMRGSAKAALREAADAVRTARIAATPCSRTLDAAWATLVLARVLQAAPRVDVAVTSKTQTWPPACAAASLAAGGWASLLDCVPSAEDSAAPPVHAVSTAPWLAFVSAQVLRHTAQFLELADGPALAGVLQLVDALHAAGLVNKSTAAAVHGHTAGQRDQAIWAAACQSAVSAASALHTLSMAAGTASLLGPPRGVLEQLAADAGLARDAALPEAVRTQPLDEVRLLARSAGPQPAPAMLAGVAAWCYAADCLAAAGSTLSTRTAWSQSPRAASVPACARAVVAGVVNITGEGSSEHARACLANAADIIRAAAASMQAEPALHMMTLWHRVTAARIASWQGKLSEACEQLHTAVTLDAPQSGPTVQASLFGVSPTLQLVRTLAAASPSDVHQVSAALCLALPAAQREAGPASSASRALALATAIQTMLKPEAQAAAEAASVQAALVAADAAHHVGGLRFPLASALITGVYM